jgi:hypothetical protein
MWKRTFVQVVDRVRCPRFIAPLLMLAFSACGFSSTPNGGGGGGQNCTGPSQMSCACGGTTVGQQAVDPCSGVPTGTCQCPTMTQACVADSGCAGKQSCTGTLCGDCVCGAPTMGWSATGAEPAKAVALAPDGTSFVLLGAAPWLAAVDGTGKTTTLSVRDDLTWASDLAADATAVFVFGSVAGTTAGPAAVQIERFDRTGMLTASGRWNIEGAATTLVAATYTASRGVVALAQTDGYIIGARAVGADANPSTTWFEYGFATTDPFPMAGSTETGRAAYSFRVAADGSALLGGSAGKGVEQDFVGYVPPPDNWLAIIDRDGLAVSEVVTGGDIGTPYLADGAGTFYEAFPNEVPVQRAPDGTYIEAHADGIIKRVDATFTPAWEVHVDGPPSSLIPIKDGVLVFTAGEMVRVNGRGVVVGSSALPSPFVRGLSTGDYEVEVLTSGSQAGPYTLTRQTFAPLQLPMVAAGGACVEDADCGAMRCCGHGISGRTCSATRTCGFTKECLIDTDCDGGYCYTGLHARYCSSHCTKSSDCPQAAYCVVDGPSGSPFCAPDCLAGGDASCMALGQFKCTTSQNQETVQVSTCQ